MFGLIAASTGRSADNPENAYPATYHACFRSKSTLTDAPCVCCVQDVPDVASRLFAFIECALLDNCIGADVLSRLPTSFVSKLDPAVVASNIVVQAAVRQ